MRSGKIGKAEKVAPAVRRRLVAAARDGATNEALSATYGVTMGCVRAILAADGFERRPAGQPYTAEQEAEIVRRYQEPGHGLVDLARRFGGTQDRVRECLQRHGVAIRRPGVTATGWGYTGKPINATRSDIPPRGEW